MATAQRALQPVWHMRLVEDLKTSDERAEKLVEGLGEEQLNWQPAQGCWSVGQCLEHLCITNEAYLPAISAALKERPDEPVEQIIPGWFGGWFIRNFIEPSPQSKRAACTNEDLTHGGCRPVCSGPPFVQQPCVPHSHCRRTE